jgi:hypothetical protein
MNAVSNDSTIAPTLPMDEETTTHLGGGSTHTHLTTCNVTSTSTPKEIINSIREHDIYIESLDHTETSLPSSPSSTAIAVVDSLCLSAKIAITYQILSNVSSLIVSEDFYIEECQLSLLNWAYRSVRDVSNKEQLEILLDNILNIFEIFPINQQDLISLNFIEKLNKIKRSVKKWNTKLSIKIQHLVTYWQNMCDMYQSQVSQFNRLLGKKIKRTFDDDDDEQRSYTTRQSSTDTIQSMVEKKKVSWIENDVEDVIDYNPNEAVIASLLHNDSGVLKE